jgi:hypothetical protein
VRKVKFQHVEVRFEGIPGRLNELRQDEIHVLPRHRPRSLADVLEVWQRRRRQQRPIIRLERIIHALPAELRRTLAARMSDLQAELGAGLRMHELDNAPPCVALRGIPKSRASGRDTAMRRDARHLGEQQSRAADGARAIVHQMPVVGHAVDGFVLGHGRDDHAVRQLHARDCKWEKHRRSRHLSHAAAPGKPLFILLHKARVAQLEIGVADALTAGEQGIGKLARFEVHIADDVLEPLHPVARRALQFKSLETALGLIRLQRRPHIGAMRHPLYQRYGVLHGKLGAGSDAEMRRVRRIADKHHISVMPPRTQDAVEVQPRGSAQVSGVAHQSAAAKIFAEQVLAKRDGLIRVVAVKTMRAPRFFPAFDNHRGDILAELVSVDLEPAMLGLFECKREGGEFVISAEPDEAAFAHVDVRLKHGRVL